MQYCSVIRGISKIAALIFSTVLSFFKIMTQYPHGCCRYSPSCGEYAKEAIRILPIPMALLKIVARIVRCNPFFQGGFDPVIPLKKGCINS